MSAIWDIVGNSGIFAEFSCQDDLSISDEDLRRLVVKWQYGQIITDTEW